MPSRNGMRARKTSGANGCPIFLFRVVWPVAAVQSMAICQRRFLLWSVPRGFAGPSLLAMVLVNKFLLHQPLNRQSKTFAREGIEIDVSTLADRVGACVVALAPLIDAIRIHVMSAERIHADDTTVPVLAKMKAVVGRIWTYVRDYAHLVIMRSSPGQSVNFLRQIREMVAGIRAMRSA